LINGDASLNGANDGMMSWGEAQRQVYYSKLAGVVTPWRLGEYPARGVLLVESLKFKVLSPEGHDYLTKSNFESEKSIWARVLSMGVVGSATMTMAIVAAGAVALSLEIGKWKL
jgi:fructose-1,6-bisphosphatase/inositol monophosphatase family enzyme